ncbi:uncharacterized protein LOC141630716 [Silene latifolia]|uniref:uncharacterized protein LOC141630716 n=1 Tax=Silene latifolia TaxID=37657 RepID=UPI003D7829ED
MSTTIARFKPSTYEGTYVPHLLDNWHREMKSVLKVVNCQEEMKTEQAAFYLKDEAGAWWNREKEGPMKFKKAMRLQFIPEHIRNKMRAEFSTFRMTDNMIVAEYNKRFNELSRYADDLELSPLTLALQFDQGLSVKILERLPAGVFKDLKDVYERAGNSERLIDMAKEKLGDKRKSNNDNSRQSGFKRGHKKYECTNYGGLGFQR